MHCVWLNMNSTKYRSPSLLILSLVLWYLSGLRHSNSGDPEWHDKLQEVVDDLDLEKSNSGRKKRTIHINPTQENVLKTHEANHSFQLWRGKYQWGQKGNWPRWELRSQWGVPLYHQSDPGPLQLSPLLGDDNVIIMSFLRQCNFQHDITFTSLSIWS